MANEYQNTQGAPAIVGPGTCGVEYGFTNERKLCSLPIGHPLVRNMWGHWRDPKLDKTIAENQLPPNTIKHNVLPTNLPRPTNLPYEATLRSGYFDVWVVVAPWDSCIAIYADEEAQGRAEVLANFCNQAYQRGHSAGLAQATTTITRVTAVLKLCSADGEDS